MPSPPRVCAEIDLSALDHNLDFARRHSGQQVMAILKAGAYGHGLSKLAKHLDDKGLPYFGVANVHEARHLADDEIQTPIFLLGASIPEEREEIVQRGWTPCLSSLAEIDDFSRLCAQHETTLAAHLAIDTGMGRGGFLPEQVPATLEYLDLPQNKFIHIKGIGSHLPSADEDRDFTETQFATFDELVAPTFPCTTECVYPPF